jgi:O-methyltransferase
VFKRLIRRLANRAGFDVSGVATFWRSQPVPTEVLLSIPEADLELARRVEPYTATSLARVGALVHAVRYIVRNHIPGDFVECGVWRGGSMMAIAFTLLAEKDTSRKLFLFDTFEGMTAPTEIDRTRDGIRARDMMDSSTKETGAALCFSSIDEVRTNLNRTDYPPAKVHFVKGRVEDTLPHGALEKIALLRLDTDWYESTRHELTHLYPLITPGGVLIIDDYGDWQGSRRATDEYIRDHPDYPMLLNSIDYSGRLVVKVVRKESP